MGYGEIDDEKDELSELKLTTAPEKSITPVANRVRRRRLYRVQLMEKHLDPSPEEVLGYGSVLPF